MVNEKIISEIISKINRIREIAAEIENVPNWPQNYWTMKGMDKKCREIQEHCRWISDHLRSG